MTRTRVRITAAILGLAAALGLTLVDMMPAHAATAPAHRDVVPLTVWFGVPDQPGPTADTCIVQGLVLGGLGAAIRYAETAPHAHAVGRTTLSANKGFTRLPQLVVRRGTRVRATAAVHSQRPVVTVERASC